MQKFYIGDLLKSKYDTIDHFISYFKYRNDINILYYDPEIRPIIEFDNDETEQFKKIKI